MFKMISKLFIILPLLICFTTTEDETEKLILAFHKFNWIKDLDEIWEITKDRCGTKSNNCKFTYDEELLDQADAVLIFEASLRDTIGYKGVLPKHSNPEQLFVFYYTNTGLNTNLRTDIPGHYFNLTMTHRRDGDIYSPFGVIEKRTEPLGEDLSELVARKTKQAVAFSSYCNTNSNRRNYMEALEDAGLELDHYGTCGTLQCGGRLHGGRRDMTCETIVKDDYKFYLAFENIVAKEYVTDKFFQAGENFVIPVILKDVGQSDIFPNVNGNPGFISVENFTKPADLAIYLDYLTRNTTAYMEYMKWHEQYQVTARGYEAFGVTGLCELCDRLQRKQKSKTYADIRRWITDGAIIEKGYVSEMFQQCFKKVAQP